MLLTCSLWRNTGNARDVDILIQGADYVRGSGVDEIGACFDYRIAVRRFAGMARAIISITCFQDGIVRVFQ